MIRTLHISNYALIDSLDIEFCSGFNIITGETGAGKSIILGALSLLLGGRADLKAVRNPQAKSVIEAEFDLRNLAACRSLLSEADLSGENPDFAILRRELLPGGRSRAFINDTPVNLQQLRDVAMHLVDIHSQNENSLLADSSFQMEVIDSMADNAGLLCKYRAAYSVYRQALRKYTATKETIQRNRNDQDFIAYQFEELERMNLIPGETEALEAERELQANAGQLRERMEAVTVPLSEDSEGSALELLGQGVTALSVLAERFSDDIGIDWQNLSERLESARLEVADIASTVAMAAARLEADPVRLQEIEDRLSQLYSLQNKHHVDNADELIALYDRLGSQLEALSDADSTLAKLETEARRAKKAATELALELSERRSKAAVTFATELRALASTLGMPNLRCEITLTRGKLTATGADQIQFLFAFNKNQNLQPVGSTASGGEVSRLMLTIKSIMAQHMELPTIIFDEVDTGVSGDIAARMAQMMSNISHKIQVITITHLPAVAAMGERHFKVYKQDDEQATTTRIRLLDMDARAAELALMLGGDASESSALEAARTLLGTARIKNNGHEHGKQ